MTARLDDDRRPFLAAFIALIALAWLVLWLWERSPSGNFLSHDVPPPPALVGIPGHGSSDTIHSLGGHEHDGTAGHRGASLPVVVTGWTLMTAAMMLPTTVPLLALFHAMTRRRSDRPLLVALLIAGYLAVWALFGVVAHAGDHRLHALVGQSDWLARRDWLIAAATVLVAGLYQFTPLKYHCLDRCRSPLGFVMGHWRGRHERRQALRLGIHHGLFCVGCCWSLMLLMFAVGVGSLGWMLLLGAVMAAEKNLPWGRRLSTPLGLILLAWGGALLARGVLA
jgi:predicted metal-binding membrane protein